ncbi:MAG TPA: M28 family peptidase [Candidatus Limnocylindrales bacterium]|nr:M28 family peptidase [Candidatus Limnocylindrales bacterium]
MFALAVLAAAFFLSLRGLRPPSPKPLEAPATEFSAARAREVLNRLVGDGVPHPTGSVANAVVRARIVQEFSHLGYSPEIHSGFGCDEYGSCAAVNNVVALLPGEEGSPSVLLAAHYDSVAAGPGAFDDGAGAATVIEIARALKAGPRPRHSIVLLIDDGEEPGLLGARVFVDQDPLARAVRAAVNVDSRGTSGSSLMFETGSANAASVELYARSARRPATSSIFYTAYKQFPNDTDFTVFKAAGWQGLNFANIGDVAHYHTPLDNFANAAPATLQHHGDNALPLLLALANGADPILPAPDSASAPAAGEAVYFDILERWTVRWPASKTLAISLAALILLLLETGWMIWKRRLAPPALFWGLAAWFVAFLVTCALALILRTILHRAGTMTVNWLAYPLPLEIAFWALALAVVSTTGLLFSRRAGFEGLWSGVWVMLALVSVLLAALAPQLSYILLVPACAAALAGIPYAFWPGVTPHCATIAAILPLAVAGLLGFAPAVLFYQGLGAPVMAGVAILLALLLSPLIPICSDADRLHGLSRIYLPGVAIAATILGAFGAIVVPAFSSKSPERVNFEYWRDADSGKAQWVVRPDSGRLPEAIRVAASFQRQEKGPLAWDVRPAFVASAPTLELAAPTFTILESSVSGGKHSYRTLLRSERAAPVAAVYFPPDTPIETVRMEGEPIEPEIDRVRRELNGWFAYSCVTMPAKGVEVSFTLPVGKPVEVVAMDVSYGLPLEGAFLSKARPFTATPSGMGDLTEVSRRVQLLP